MAIKRETTLEAPRHIQRADTAPSVERATSSSILRGSPRARKNPARASGASHKRGQAYQGGWGLDQSGNPSRSLMFPAVSYLFSLHLRRND
jgi:hypothetical protein